MLRVSLSGWFFADPSLSCFFEAVGGPAVECSRRRLLAGIIELDSLRHINMSLGTKVRSAFGQREAVRDDERAIGTG